MSKQTSNNPSFWLIAFHIFMVCITAGNWLWVLAIYFAFKYFKMKNKER